MAKSQRTAESDLYAPTERFVRSKMSCWQTRIKAGVTDVGEVDVIGARFVGGDLSGQSEIVAVEVKVGTARFAVSAGQAHGYSVLAERCYLAAITDQFTPTQVLIASRLGVGLIRITQTSSGGFRFSEVLTAPSGRPVEELRLQAADRLGLASCSLCQGLFRRYADKPEDYRAVMRSSSRGTLHRAAKEDKGFVWWLGEQAEEHGRYGGHGYTRVRRYLCPSCVQALAPA